jgi:DNA-binding transcriptional LysR family regulator
MWTEADMLALVSAGAGIAFVNSSQCFRPPQSIRFCKVSDFSVGLELCFVRLKENRSPTVKHLADILIETEAAHKQAAPMPV